MERPTLPACRLEAPSPAATALARAVAGQVEPRVRACNRCKLLATLGFIFVNSSQRFRSVGHCSKRAFDDEGGTVGVSLEAGANRLRLCLSDDGKVHRPTMPLREALAPV